MRREILYRAAIRMLALIPASGAHAQYAAPQAYTAPQVQYVMMPQPVAAPQVQMIQVSMAAPQVARVSMQGPCFLDRCIARLGQRMMERGDTRVVIRMKAAPAPQVYMAPQPGVAAMVAAPVPVASAQSGWIPTPATAPAATAQRTPPPASEAAPEPPRAPAPTPSPTPGDS
jgi:hypothetical protein